MIDLLALRALFVECFACILLIVLAMFVVIALVVVPVFICLIRFTVAAGFNLLWGPWGAEVVHYS